MNQLESTLEVLKERSGDAVEAVQHGVEVIGTRLGVIEPPRRRRRAPWLVAILVTIVVAGVWWQMRTRRTAEEAAVDEAAGTKVASRSA
jgi:hypothetical protein